MTCFGTPASGNGDSIGYGSELITGKKSRAVETIVRFESDSKKGAVRFHFQILQLTAVAWQLAINRHKIGYFDVITG